MEKKNEKVTAEKIFNQKNDTSVLHAKKNTTRIISAFIIGGVVGALVMSAFGGDGTFTSVNTSGDIQSVSSTTNDTKSVGANISSSTQKTVTNAGIATGSVASGVSSGTVSVNNQSAGNSVIVESVTVPPPGVWVAVQETHGNQLGNVLGATRVHGPLSNVVVNLLRNTQPNRNYAIVLYRDGGDGGIFDLKVDSVYVDFDSGERVVVPFRTTSVVNIPNQ